MPFQVSKLESKCIVMRGQRKVSSLFRWSSRALPTPNPNGVAIWNLNGQYMLSIQSNLNKRMYFECLLRNKVVCHLGMLHMWIWTNYFEPFLHLSLVENMVKKEPHSFSHCGSFDHHALQPLNNCIFVFLDLPMDTLGILGLVVYRWKVFEDTFPTIYHTPQNI